MNEHSVRQTRWQPVLDQMFEELRAGSPRAEVYWAQQLAFGPVFFYAVLLAVREDILSSEDKDHLRRIVPMALSLLGALPEGNDVSSTSLLLLARRQAAALAVGRRRQLTKLAARLGLEISAPPYGPVPGRLQRPYELIGWRPPG